MTKNMRKKFLTGCFTVLAGAVCAVSANGIARLVSKAEESAEPTVAEFTADKLVMPGAMVRIADDGKNGIRFPVRMSVSDFETYKDSIAESGTMICPQDLYDGTSLQEDKDTYTQVTTNNWKKITDKKTGEEWMQTLVYVYNLPEDQLNKEFYFQGYVKMKEGTDPIYSEELNRSMTSVAKAALPDYANDATKSDILKEYIRYDVTFVDGETSTTTMVGYDSTVSAPTDPTPAQSYEFKYWATEDGEEYDFDAVVTEDITLTAVYEQVSRYEVMISDGTDIGTGIGLDTAETKTTDELLFSNVDGNDVIELKMTGTGATSGQYALVHFSREGAYAQAIKQASGKKYVGFRIYNPVKEEIFVRFLVHTGAKAPTTEWRLCYGWNEFSIDLNDFLKDKGIDFVASEETPIYRIGIGINDKACGTTVGTVRSFYIDDVYATDYDVENTVDFESEGDLNRYAYGESVTSAYTYNCSHYGTSGGATAVAGVEVDGEKVLKVTTNATNAYAGALFYLGLNNNYTNLWFTQDLSGYSAIKIRAKVDLSTQFLRFYLTSKDTTVGEKINNRANTVAYAQIVSGTTDWVEYTIDLTTIDAANLTTLKQIEFDMGGTGALNHSFYIDYIQFVK